MYRQLALRGVRAENVSEARARLVLAAIEPFVAPEFCKKLGANQQQQEAVEKCAQMAVSMVSGKVLNDDQKTTLLLLRTRLQASASN